MRFPRSRYRIGPPIRCSIIRQASLELYMYSLVRWAHCIIALLPLASGTASIVMHSIRQADWKAGAVHG